MEKPNSIWEQVLRLDTLPNMSKKQNKTKLGTESAGGIALAFEIG